MNPKLVDFLLMLIVGQCPNVLLDPGTYVVCQCGEVGRLRFAAFQCP